MIDLSSLAKLAGSSGIAAALPIVVSYSYFVQQQVYDRHVAEERTRAVQELIETLSKEPSGPYHDTLCKTLETTLTQICLDSEEHPFCLDRAVLKEKAGCP